MKRDIVVIGAGIAGLLAAWELAAQGNRVRVLEKSRGVGGRLATKRVGAGAFDQGAQYFTVREEAFRREVTQWETAGVTKIWDTVEGKARWIGQPSMNALGKWLAQGLDVSREQKVTATRRGADGAWELEVEGAELVRAKTLILSAPVPQSLALLTAGGVSLPESEWAGLAALRYHPCLALLVSLDGASAVPEEGVALSDGPLRWVADNGKKGVRQGEGSAVTLHASAEYSAANYSKSEVEVAADLVPAARGWLGNSAVVTATLHRWKFSQPANTHARRCVWLAEMGLGFCGDGFGGPRVEGAALSGLAMAAAVGV